MFKTARVQHVSTERGDATRDHIVEVALKLFRKRGFERTTMRDIASAAKVSLGAAYYYFPSKEALVHAFYDRIQDVHRERTRAACAGTDDLRACIAAALLGKLEVIQEDRRLLGALFRFVGEPDHGLSVFSSATREQREAAISTFSLALAGAGLPPAVHDAAARALWLVHLGLVLYFIHDHSQAQVQTRQLAGRAADLFCRALRLASLPGASAMLTPVLEALADAGLVPPPPRPQEAST